MNESKVEVTVRMKEISLKLAEILKNHGGLESNVPVTVGHEYWGLKAELNDLRTKSPNVN